MKALQQEKELDAKYQTVKQTSSSPSPSSSSSIPTTTTNTTTSSSSHNKHSSSKPLSTKVSSSKHHHSGKTSSSKHSINNNNNTNNTNNINPLDMFASSLAALPTHEQIELFQKHFLSNMFQFNVANQAAALVAAYYYTNFKATMEIGTKNDAIFASADD